MTFDGLFDGNPAVAGSSHERPDRSYLLCDLCSRRMFGKTGRRITRADDTYYACVTKREHHKTEPWYDLHPDALTVREDAVDPFVARFFNERVFGPHRLTYLQGPVDEPVRSNHEAAAAAYAKQLDELDAANKNLILSPGRSPAPTHFVSSIKLERLKSLHRGRLELLILMGPARRSRDHPLRTIATPFGLSAS